MTIQFSIFSNSHRLAIEWHRLGTVLLKELLHMNKLKTTKHISEFTYQLGEISIDFWSVSNKPL